MKRWSASTGRKWPHEPPYRLPNRQPREKILYLSRGKAMARRDAEQSGKFIVLAAIAGAFTLAVTGGMFWLAFRHPNESEAAKQARERQEQDRAYYDSLGPFDTEKAEKERAERIRIDAEVEASNRESVKKAQEAAAEYNRKHFKQIKP